MFGVRLPRVVIGDGAIEAIKWLALVLMTLDHINKYLLHDASPVLFALGRVVMPLFGFVLAFNLARPGALANGVYPRVMCRLAIVGAVTTPVFTGLGGLLFGWWPLNILWMLLTATAAIYFLDKGGRWNMLAAVVTILIGGSSVEFWWPGVGICVSAWYYVKRPSLGALAIWVGSTAALALINQDFWACAAFAIIIAASRLGPMAIPRMRRTFYVYYPAHLTVICALGFLLRR